MDLISGWATALSEEYTDIQKDPNAYAESDVTVEDYHTEMVQVQALYQEVREDNFEQVFAKVRRLLETGST